VAEVAFTRPPTEAGLFQGGLDGGKRAFEMGADPGKHRNDRDCNAGRDKAVFNSGGRRLVSEEGSEFSEHVGICSRPPLKHP
jgi:hypothetical protein